MKSIGPNQIVAQETTQAQQQKTPLQNVYIQKNAGKNHALINRNYVRSRGRAVIPPPLLYPLARLAATVLSILAATRGERESINQMLDGRWLKNQVKLRAYERENVEMIYRV